jgi:hypothetical protein
MNRRAVVPLAFLSGLGYNFKIPTVFQQGQEKSSFSRDVLFFQKLISLPSWIIARKLSISSARRANDWAKPGEANCLE